MGVTEIREKVADKPVVYHLECTELFCFLMTNGIAIRMSCCGHPSTMKHNTKLTKNSCSLTNAKDWQAWNGTNVRRRHPYFRRTMWRSEALNMACMLVPQSSPGSMSGHPERTPRSSSEARWSILGEIVLARVAALCILISFMAKAAN